MKYYLRHLHDIGGTLYTYGDQAGSVTTNPHNLFPKQVRKMCRELDAWSGDSGFEPIPHEKKGLAYGVWTLPDSAWSVSQAAQWAQKNPGLMELYVILRGDGGWFPTMVAMHPDNPVVFTEPYTSEE